MTRDGGVMLLAKLDQRLGLTDAAARCITDPRQPASISHSIRDMLRQCVYALVQGWEDLNNHSQLRHDIAYQTAVGREHDVASAPTLCRLQKLGSRAVAVKFHAVAGHPVTASVARRQNRLPGLLCRRFRLLSTKDSELV